MTNPDQPDPVRQPGLTSPAAQPAAQPMANTTQFIPNPFTSRFCEMMNTPSTHDRMPAKYLIGQPNPASIANPGFLAVCEPCAKSIAARLPDELLPYVPLDCDRALAALDALIQREKLQKIGQLIQDDPALLEMLADRIHDQWATWARSMIDRWDKKAVERWERQIATDYCSLPQKDKEKDRRVIRKLFAGAGGSPENTGNSGSPGGDSAGGSNDGAGQGDG